MFHHKYIDTYNSESWVVELDCEVSTCIMAIWVVEFSNGGTKLERVLPKNQHTQRKLLNFENWISGGLMKFSKIRVL